MQDRLLYTRVKANKANVLLLGPRQVGKSTICRALGPDLYVDLADEREFLDYAKDPALFRRVVETLDGHSLIVVDEVQRVPSLLNTIQCPVV